MPDRAAKDLRDFLDGPDFLVPASESRVSDMAIIHAMRGTADALGRLADQQASLSEKMDRNSDVLHGMDKRLAVIEASGILHTLEEHDRRIQSLEDDRSKREGAIGMAQITIKYGPAFIGIIAIIMAMLLATGEVNL